MAKIVKKSEDPEAQRILMEQQKNMATVLFAVPKGFDEKKLTRRNMPRLIQPDSVPVGSIVSGKIINILESPVATIKGKLIHLEHESGEEFTFPCTGVIRQALVPGRFSSKNEEENEAKLMEALQKEIGKMLYAKRLPDGTDRKFKKRMFVFDVFTTEK